MSDSSDADHFTNCIQFNQALMKKIVSQDDIIEDLYADVVDLNQELDSLQWQFDQLVAQNTDMKVIINQFELANL